MNTEFHRIATTIAFEAMPEDFKEKFLSGFSFELLLEYVDVPYVPQQFGEDESLHLGHSYKLLLKGRDLHRVGDTTALDEIANYAKGVPTLIENGQGSLARFNIAKGAHYITDIGTFPHVNAGTWDKYHTKYEDLASVWLCSHKGLVEDLIKNYNPNPMRNVQNRVRSITERAFFDSMDFLPAFRRNGLPTDLQIATMCCNHIYDLMDWFSTFEKAL